MQNAVEQFRKLIVNRDLNVASGVYCAVDPQLRMEMNDRGEYDYVGLDEHYTGPVQRLLALSAFGGLGPSEPEVAETLFAGQAGIRSDEVAGLYLEAYAGYAHGPLREHGSSGGLTTWLLVEMLERGMIDGVIHMAPGPDARRMFTYRVSRTPDEIRSRAKSRYFPGELSDSLAEVAAQAGRFAVVAIPSIAYEVRLLQRAEPIFAERIRFVVGLICGHQKTANYAEFLAWSAGFSPGSEVRIDFRKKRPGHPADSYATEFSAQVGGEVCARDVEQTDLFGTDWGHGLFKSAFSDFTEDALNETADVVFGDAWLPEYVSDSRGTNVVIARSEVVRSLLNDGVRSGQIYLERVPIDRVVASQRALVRHNVHELPYRLKKIDSATELARPLRRPTGARMGMGRRRVQRVRRRMSQASHVLYLEARRLGDLHHFHQQMSRFVQAYERAQRIARFESRMIAFLRRWRDRLGGAKN